MPASLPTLVCLLIALSSLLSAPCRAQGTIQLPPGFTKTDIAGGWTAPVGVTFDANGRMYVWERAGKVWIVENGAKLPTPLVDISDEVASYSDHGMLGFALHPNFLQNGWIYLLYAVDHYYLQYSNDPNYNPGFSDYNAPTLGRITRYTARASDGFRTVDPASRLVLLGEVPGTGCPILFNSHGVGSLVFGTDDSLLASCGDGASFVGADSGGPTFGAKTVQGLAEGFIAPYEDVGAFRAQLPSSLSGKLLRLDPRTGNGVPSNPYFDPLFPRSALSRVYALGFRNPFRFTLRPGTGSHWRGDGAPGVLYVGNVGSDYWEELDVVDGPAFNSGWPVYEGMDASVTFASSNPANQTAPNPLSGVGGCAPFFTFKDLLVQATQGVPSWPNPCNPTQQVPASIPRFMHDRPVLAYAHSANGPMRTPTFTGGVATSIDVGAPGSPVAGTPVGGSTPTGGVWYTGADFPPEYRNTFFWTDYSQRWLLSIHFDASDRPTEVAHFGDLPGGVASLATSPTTPGLFAVDLDYNNVYRISYASGANQPPVARASAAPTYGSTPLVVQLTGDASSDPEALPLGYEWDFGDGSAASTIANPTHAFAAPPGVPTGYTVSLLVRDSQSQTSTAQLLVALNDTPPSVAITSPPSQGLYPMASPTIVPLQAQISDAEHGPAELTCTWQTTLHHNGQPFPAPPVAGCAASAELDPVGCDGSEFYYAIALTVTDAVGLATTRQVDLVPDCASLLPTICGDLNASALRDSADVLRLRTALSDPIGNGLAAGELARCSVIGDAGCDVADLSVLRRYLQGMAPGPSPVCPAATP